jgi:hypothetical protein
MYILTGPVVKKGETCLEVWLWLFFKVFFYLKITFNINSLKWSENIKTY